MIAVNSREDMQTIFTRLHKKQPTKMVKWFCDMDEDARKRIVEKLEVPYLNDWGKTAAAIAQALQTGQWPDKNLPAVREAKQDRRKKPEARITEFKIDNEFRDFVPPMDEQQFADLKESIKQIGMQETIKVQPDGTIVDGHHRYRAVCELREEGVEIQIKYEEINETDRGKLLGLIDAWNYRRRHLKLLPTLKRAVEKKRQLQEKIKANKERRKNGEAIEAIGVAVKKVAQEMGVSESSIQQMERVEKKKEEHPDIFKAVESEEMSPAKGDKIIREREKESKTALVPEIMGPIEKIVVIIMSQFERAAVKEWGEKFKDNMPENMQIFFKGLQKTKVLAKKEDKAK